MYSFLRKFMNTRIIFIPTPFNSASRCCHSSSPFWTVFYPVPTNGNLNNENTILLVNYASQPKLLICVYDPTQNYYVNWIFEDTEIPMPVPLNFGGFPSRIPNQGGSILQNTKNAVFHTSFYRCVAKDALCTLFGQNNCIYPWWLAYTHCVKSSPLCNNVWGFFSEQSFLRCFQKNWQRKQNLPFRKVPLGACSIMCASVNFLQRIRWLSITNV